MAANGTAMLLNLDLGIVGEGEFGIEMKDGVKVFNIKHCIQECCLVEWRMLPKLRCFWAVMGNRVGGPCQAPGSSG